MGPDEGRFFAWDCILQIFSVITMLDRTFDVLVSEEFEDQR